MDNVLKDEAAEILREIVGGREFYAGRLKVAFAVAARKTGLTIRRVRSLWFREARVWGDEIEILRRKRNEIRTAKTGMETNEIDGRQADLLGRLEKLQNELASLHDELAKANSVGRSDDLGKDRQVRRK